MMREAIETIQKEILTNNEAFQCKKRTLQRSAKIYRNQWSANKTKAQKKPAKVIALLGTICNINS